MILSGWRQKVQRWHEPRDDRVKHLKGNLLCIHLSPLHLTFEFTKKNSLMHWSACIVSTLKLLKSEKTVLNGERKLLALAGKILWRCQLFLCREFCQFTTEKFVVKIELIVLTHHDTRNQHVWIENTSNFGAEDNENLIWGLIIFAD